MEMTKGMFIAHKEPKVIEMLERYMAMDPVGTPSWMKMLDEDVNTLFAIWEIDQFHVNPDAYMGLVLVCNSLKYGGVVIKMYPPFLQERYFRESYIYQTLHNYHQCVLLECDSQKFAMLLQKILPGTYISYPRDEGAIIRLFRDMERNKLSIFRLNDQEYTIQSILGQTEGEYVTALKQEYHPELIAYLLEAAKDVYNRYFSNEEKYLLHGDVYFKNALIAQDGIQSIDPFGYQDAYVFEYMPFFTYELLLHAEPCSWYRYFHNLMVFFGKFTDISKFQPAIFIFLVRQLVPSIYEGNDGFKRADRFLMLIRKLYLDENDRLVLKKPVG